MQRLIRLPKRSPLASQALVISALMRRELATRMGRYNFGFFWMLLEPLLGVLIIGVLLGGFVSRSVPEIPYPFFVLHGFLLLGLFTGTMNSGASAVTANQGLLLYPSVKPIDLFFARFIFEFIEAVLAAVIFIVIGAWMGVHVAVHSLDKLFLCYFLTCICGSGFGLLFGIATMHVPDVQKVVMVLQRPLLFLSCVIMPLRSLPESAERVLLYNPLVHCVELARQCLFPFYSVGGSNLLYPSVFGIIVWASGLCFYHLNRNAVTLK